MSTYRTQTKSTQQLVNELHALFQRAGDLIEYLAEEGGVTTNLIVQQYNGEGFTINNLTGEFVVTCFRSTELKPTDG